MDPSRCVVIELELPAEEQLLKYLSERKSSYNWILKEGDGAEPKVRVCVWWKKEDYKEFSTTPLRSFLKRMKNKSGFTPKVSGRISTVEGVRRVCQRERNSISKYYLEGPLLSRLGGLLLNKPPGLTDSPSKGEVTDRGDSSKLNILGKLNLLLEIADVIATHVVKLSEVKRLSEPD